MYNYYPHEYICENCGTFSNASFSCAGSFFLFFHMPGESISGHGVLEWRRSLLLVEKSWLLGRRHGPHIYRRSCKAVCHLKICSITFLSGLRLNSPQDINLIQSNAFSGACSGIFAFCKYHSQRLKARQFVDQSGWSHQGQYILRYAL